MTPEGALQKTILDWLAAKRILAFRMNTGAVKTDARFFRFGVPGMADILAFFIPEAHRHCCMKGPLIEILWIEVKTFQGRQSPLQKSFQQQVEAAGHRYVVCRSIEDLEKVIK